MQHVQTRSTTSALVLTAVLIVPRYIALQCIRKFQYLAYAAISMLEMSLS